MTLENRAAALMALVTSALSVATINKITDFALEANDADRADLSIELLVPLARVAPTNARVWQMLGLAHRQLQNSAAAVEALGRAAALAPSDVRIANGRATAALEAGIPSALLFKTAQDMSPNDPELLLSTVASLNADGYPEVAEPLLARNVTANPGWVRGHEALATLRLTMSADPDFARSFSDAIAQVPDSLSLYLAWQRALAQAGRWEAARIVIDQGRATLGDKLEFDAADANIATETGDFTLADRFFAKVTTLDDPGTRISHIRHCLRTGRIDQAEAIAMDALTRQLPTTVWAYLSLIWRLRGDPRAAWLDGAPPMVTVTDMPFTTGELELLADALRTLHTTHHHPAEQSVRGGTQTEGVLFARTDPLIQSLRAKVVQAVRAYVDRLPPFDASHPLLGTPRGNLLFAGSWSVRLKAQGFHTCHTHPLGWISSALYVALPESLGPAPAGWLELGAPPSDLRLDLPAYQRVEPKPGRLVLFPSTMWHGTVPFDDGERLTVAFDVARPSR
jgi:tetratricopeptide (TPR) repeat protein